MIDLWNQLLQGFATAGTPINLLWALLGCTIGTAVGVLPGIGPATAVAMLLPITAKVDATASMIFFAGIYYGAMYGGSTTSILLNTPGEAGSMVTAMEGNKMAKNGRAGAALATAAIGSFVAGTIATVLVTLFAPLVAAYAVRLGPPEYFLLMVLAFTTVTAVLGKSTCAASTALCIGLALGLVGIDQISGQARYTGGVPELMDSLEVVLVAVGLFAVGEALYMVLYEGKAVETQNKLSKVHMTRERVEALLAGLAARHRDRLSVRHHPGRRQRDPHLPQLRHREEALEAQGGVRHDRRDRGRGRAGGGEQRGDHRHPGSAADPRHPDLEHHRDPARRLPELRHPARAAAVRHQRRAGLGADRLALHRQRHAAGAQPAAGGHVGEAAEDPASRSSTPAS